MFGVHSISIECFFQRIRRRKTIGRTIKSLRPSNRTNLNPPPDVVDSLSLSPMPTTELLPPLTDGHDDDDVFSKDFPVLGQPDTVCVDVSGHGYVRQSLLHVSTTSTLCRSLPRLLSVAAVEDDSDVAAEHRRLSSWRKTICDVGDVSKAKPRRQLMLFSAVDVDRSTLFRGLATKKSTSSRQSLFTAGDRGGRRMTSTLQIYTARQGFKLSARSTPGARGTDVDEVWRPHANSHSSSWRQSLKSLLKGVVRTKSSVDLWATTTVQHQGGGCGVTAGARKTPINFRRANSLPRSLKAMKRHSGADAAEATTKSKSKSVEDQLDSTDRSSRSSFRPEMTPAGERLGRSLSLSRCHGAKSRVHLRPQSMEVHIVAVDEFGRPSSVAGPYSGGETERRVHVNIPAQPWTKPFANVRLRQRSARVIESDKYQSSSGTSYYWKFAFRYISVSSVSTVFIGCHHTSAKRLVV